MARTVLSDRAERAGAELMFAWAAHRRWRRQQRLTSLGRLGRSGSDGLSPIGYLTLPHIAAVAEEYSRSMLLACSEPLVPQTHAILDELWEDAERRAETWPGQEKAWRGWHGIDIAREQPYQELRGVIEARNAIVHGIGELTKRQTRGKDGGKKVIAALKKVGIRVSGRKVVVDDEAMKTCIDTARGFIGWLDLEIQGRGLKAAKP